MSALQLRFPIKCQHTGPGQSLNPVRLQQADQGIDFFGSAGHFHDDVFGSGVEVFVSEGEILEDFPL